MNRQQRTSRYFLQHLLPRDALAPSERSRLDAVLRAGGTDAERRLAVELAEALASRGVYRRGRPGHYGNPATRETYRLCPLAVPREPVAPEASPPATTPSTPPVPVEGGVRFDRLREVLAVLRLQGRQPGILAGVGRLLAALDRWYPGSGHCLYHFETLAQGDTLAGLRSLEPDTLAPGHPYRQALATRGVSRLDPQAAAASGWYPPRAGADARWLLLPLRLPADDADASPWALLELRLPPALDDDSLDAELGLLGEALSELVHNHRVLSDVVYVDGLTQVFNRSFLDLQLPVEVERARRNDETLAVLVVDLDDFKRINDTFGHEAGDRVLRSLGMLVRDTMRRVDQVFRFGGEEFVVLLPRLDEDSALRAAERLRLAVAEHRVELRGSDSPLGVTVSIGGALYPRDGADPDALFREADAACYRSKRDGKNRVSFAGPPGV
ncbi:MAG: GGDEF domain-containing protein [Candidatus Krumholzibacteriia bacterium]